MSVDNNTTKTSFFQKIGNWWNKNGNTVGKGMQLAGTTAMGAGMTGMFINALNEPNSIFGGGYGMYNPYMMMGGYSPYSMMNPMMMSMGGSLFGMGGMGCCPTGMAANSAYQYGFMLGMQNNMQMAYQAQQFNTQYPAATNPYLQQTQATTNTDDTVTTTTDDETESDTWDDTKVDFTGSKLKRNDGDSEEGETFDLKTDKLYSGEKKSITIVDSEDSDKIKEGLIKSGKDMVAFLDSDDGDGYVDVDEYLANEKKKSGFNATVANRAFKKMDLNNDGKLDWTEFASIQGTFTTSYTGENKPEGSITKTNYKKWSEALGDAADNKVVRRTAAIRKWLMGSDS